jgi:Transposase DDE domain group 1
MNAQLFNDPMVSGVAPMPAVVATQRQPLPLPLAPIGTKAVELDFDGGRLSSEAGVVLLKDIDDPLGLTRALAAGRSDPREERRIHCTPEDWLKQRVLHIAAGYEDANGANTLRDDPIFTLRRDHRPETGAPVASQPTLSRCENRIARPEL